MDILALACQEIGLDELEFSSSDSHISIVSEYYPPSKSHELPDPDTSKVEIKTKTSKPCLVLHKQLSFDGAVPKKGSRPNFENQLSGRSKSSLVSNLYQQKQANSSVFRRFLPYQKSQGLSFRNIPELQSREKCFPSTTPVSDMIEVPKRMSHYPFLEDNPFISLFDRAVNQGQVAFAFYASDCWLSLKESSHVPIVPEQILQQCEQWWSNLPPPYKRGYWLREYEYKKKLSLANNIRIGQPLGNDGFTETMVDNIRNNNEESFPIIVKDESILNEEAVMEDASPNLASLESSDDLILADEVNNNDNVSSERAKGSPKMPPTAFENFQLINRGWVAEVMSSENDILDELDRLWQSLTDIQKSEYISNAESNEDNLEEKIQNVLKREMVTEEINNWSKVKEKVLCDTRMNMVSLTLDEIEFYALEPNIVIEE